IGSDPLTAGFETRIGLLASFEDNALSDRRTLAGTPVLIRSPRYRDQAPLGTSQAPICQGPPPSGSEIALGRGGNGLSTLPQARAMTRHSREGLESSNRPALWPPAGQVTRP